MSNLLNRQRVVFSLLLLALLLTACQQAGASEPAPITGSGTLEGREVTVASELGGRIVALPVGEGDLVVAGAVLVRLDEARAQAQRAQAQAAVAAAEANLARQQAGSRPETIAAAEAQLQYAQAQAEGAHKALLHARHAITNPVELDLQIAEARTQVKLAEQQVEKAEADLAAEQLNYHIYVELKENVGDDTRRMWDLRLQAARQSIAQAEADRASAQANLNALYAMREEPLEDEARLHGAAATYTATLAAVEAAQAGLANLQSGTRPEALSIAKAQVLQAHAALTMALTQVDMLTLTAPISGVVGARSFYTGEIAPQGLPILTLADLDTLYLTLYVPQARLNDVRMGQQVEVSVDTYGPNEVFLGSVERIAREAEFTPSDVQTEDDRARLVFAVRVRIPNPEHRLRPGMPADGVILP